MTFRPTRSPRFFWLVWATIYSASALFPLAAAAIELQSGPFFPDPGKCLTRLWDKPWLWCRNRIIPVQGQTFPSGAADIGQWNLVRTPGPEEGHEVVSIMHTADALQSDPDFAGLMIRCREKSSLQIGLVVIRPFPPRAHPQVSITDGHKAIRLQASVLPSGIVLTLPNVAEVLAKGPWQSLNRVSFAIEGEGMTIHGIVPLEKLSAALAYLRSNCPEQ